MKKPSSSPDNIELPVDFATILASSVHDMKNSLAMVVQDLEQVAEQTRDSSVGGQVAQIHYEAQRINASLVQLLNVYRHQQHQMSLNVEPHYVDEILEELVMNNTLYLEQRGIEVQLSVDDACLAYFDRDLIIQLLNDIVINAMRYTVDKLSITAQSLADSGVVITVEDNGPGYPSAMLTETQTPANEEMFGLSRTGLGLYFAQQIAQAHQRFQKRGFIELKNGGHLGGSVFTLTLP